MLIYDRESWIKEGARVGICHCTKGVGVLEHKHEFIEIVYILSGKATQFVDGEKYEVSRGDMLYISYGSVHSFESEDKAFSYVNIFLSPETAGQVIVTQENALSLLLLTAFDELRKDQGGGMIRFEGKERGEIESIISSMITEHSEERMGYATVLESYLNVIVTKMLRKVEQSFSGEAFASGGANDFWDTLKEYIDENLTSLLTLDALAKQSFYNPSYFSRAFKQRFGTSLTEYVGRRRIEYAVKLLGETELSVEEIARRSGFADRSGFYHAFSKYTGKSPSDYRSN